MITCPSCAADNAVDQTACRSCGKALPAPQPSQNSSAQTVAGSAPARPTRQRPYRVLDLTRLFEKARNKVVIGRSSDCDVCLPHPNVSRYHAMLLRRPDGRVELRDLKSVNGVFVGGRRLTDVRVVEERERLGIGPFLLTLDRDLLYLLDSSRSLRLEARGLKRDIRLPSGGSRTLLQDVNLVVEPGEFVTLLGPSGSGKSTLMDCLNGRRRATGGQVLANGEDFYRHFDSFRQSLGYVPQRDIVHTGLTVYKALRYTARLRLPADTGPGELEDRIAEVLREMELLDHQKTTVGNLSGGQIKRVSLGAELLARPSLLYIDEATSGLDAGTDAKMMKLFRRLAGEGRSIVCITHNVENVDSCHLILVLTRGRVVYYGPPEQAHHYFEVGRIGDVYDRLAEREPEYWEKRFQDSDLHHRYVAKRLEVELSAEQATPTAAGQIAQLGQELRSLVGNIAGEVLRLPAERDPHKGPTLRQTGEVPAVGPQESRRRSPWAIAWRQFVVLTERYVELLWRDRRTVWLLAMQAPIVAAFILLGFANKPYQQKILAPRPLEPEERLALELLDRMSEDLPDDPVLAERVRETLRVKPIELPDGQKVDPDKVVELALRFKNERLTRKILDSPLPVMPDREIINPRYTYMLLFIVAVTVIWFGCNNAAKEIVKEEAIYSRERAVNLGILPYLGSKFLVLSVLTAFHVLLLMLVIYGGLGLMGVLWHHDVPDPSQRADYLTQYGVLCLLGVAGVALGLLVSACASSPDRASTLLPYVLIPQIILGGGMLAVSSEPLHTMSHVCSPVYWAFRGIVRGTLQLPEMFRIDSYTEEGVGLPLLMLAAQSVALLLLTVWAMRRKDVG